jgi:hypothetical protein
MFGKLFGYLSYLQSLSVYQIKRYPTNKISIGGMILTYLSAYYLFTRLRLRQQTRKLNGETTSLCSLMKRAANLVSI